jgi:hypothetical protein
MELEEQTVEDNLEERCEVCGVELTREEILSAREAGGAFLCSVHAAEELPIEPENGSLPDSETEI